MIYLNQPYVNRRGIEYISDAIASSEMGGDGKYTQLCSEFLGKKLNTFKVLLTTSCTHALEMSALLLGIMPGDEIILPSYTFTSTANAFVLRGAKPVFADIRPDTLNIDENLIEKLITPKTRVIVPVHYGGVGCEMDKICDIAKTHNVAVVEDNAHGLFGRYNENYLGTFGELAAVSFHNTKNIVSGEGGALIINKESFCDRAEIIRNKGTNLKLFLSGSVDKYTWVDIGSSYLMSDILAALLWSQLEDIEFIDSERKRVWEYYFNNLVGWSEKNDIKLPYIPHNCKQSYHIFYLILPNYEIRSLLIKYLKDCGIQAAFHYYPLHLSEMGKSFGYREGDLPLTESLSSRILRLPIYPTLTNDELAVIVDLIMKFKV